MSKIVFNKVVMKNFMAFGNKPTEMKLDEGLTYGIIGENRDVGSEGISRNGAAKTTTFAAIIYGTFGKSIDKIKADEFINIINGKQMVVEVYFTKGDVQYVIKRGRKPNFLSLVAIDSIGEETDLTMDSMANTDKEIERILGMTYEIFMSTIFLSPHRESFMEMSGPSQRTLIEQMLSLDTLTERSDSIKKIRDELNVEIKVLGREVELQQANHEKWEARGMRLQESFDKWDMEHQLSLEKLKKRKLELSSIDFDGLYDDFLKLNEISDQIYELQEVIIGTEEEINRVIRHNESILQADSDIERFEKMAETSQERYHEMVGGVERDISTILDQHPNIEEYQGDVDKGEIYLSLVDTKVDYERTIREIESSNNRDVEDLERICDEIDAIKDGKCHVCGGHYEDEKKLENLTRKFESLSGKVEQDTEKLRDIHCELDKVAKDIDEILTSKPYLVDFGKTKISEMKSVLQDIDRLYSKMDELENSAPETYEKEIREYTERRMKLGDMISDEDISSLKSDIPKIQEEIHVKEAEVGKLLEELTGYNDKSDLDKMKMELEHLDSTIDSKEAEVNPYLNEIEEHKKESLEDIESLVGRLDDYKTKVEHCQYLIKLLTDPKSFIRRGILDRYIPYLNKQINGHLEKLGLSHVVEVTSDLNVEILYMGRGVSYYNLSRGERLRLNIATTMAFRSLMEMTGKTCNLLLIDEVLDSGLDQSGIISASVLLQESADDLFLISHREDLLETLNRKIIAVKENGFSHLEFA